MKPQKTLFILLAYAASSLAAQESDTIQWQLVAGDKLQSTHEQRTSIETSIDNRRKQIGNDMLLVIDWIIDKVEDNRIEMTQSINRIKLEIRRPSKTATETTIVDTESNDEPTPGLAKGLYGQITSLIGTEFKVVMTTRGEIVEVTIPESSKSTVRSAPASMLLRQILTTDGLKKLIGQACITFPENESQKQWKTNSENTNALGKLRKETVVNYEGKSKRNGANAHTFALNSIAKTIDAATTSDAPTMDDYSGWGKVWYSPDTKQVYESEFENRMNLTRQYRDQKIISAVSTTNKMRVIKQ